jgi:hypothetical protein
MRIPLLSMSHELKEIRDILPCSSPLVRLGVWSSATVEGSFDIDVEATMAKHQDRRKYRLDRPRVMAMGVPSLLSLPLLDTWYHWQSLRVRALSEAMEHSSDPQAELTLKG